MNIVFNEEKFVEEILEGNHLYLGVRTTSKYLIRKMYKDCVLQNGKVDSECLKMKVLFELNILFSNEDIVSGMSVIKSNIRKFAKPKYDLQVSDGIRITSGELSKISGLNNDLLEVLSFSILVLKKIDNFKLRQESTWYNKEFRDYYKVMTNDKRCMKGQNATIRNLQKNGLIELPDISNGGKSKGFKLLYMDLDDAEFEMLIDDIREIPLWYKRWKGENVVKCEECKRLIEKEKKDKTKYCKTCAKEVKLRNDRENQKRRYDSRI